MWLGAEQTVLLRLSSSRGHVLHLLIDKWTLSMQRSLTQFLMILELSLAFEL